MADVSHINTNMRTKGTISSWNDEKGYGFIDPESGGKRVFIHIKAFDNRGRRPELNQTVTYAISMDKQGRPCAVKATLAGDRLSQKKKAPNGALSTTGAAVFLMFVGALVITSKVPSVIFAIYLIASLITFAVYAMDKSAARKGSWRTQESTLHILSLLGGWPGALVAQQKLRHKSRKQPFRAVYWVTVIVNCGAFAWVLTPSGATTLRSLLAAVA
jgi:uncharacterized membrane protein YsdA (DUF1294 family)/cold shock CspA family protein